MSDKSLTTLPQKRSASPESVVDALFAKFAAIFGKHWLDMWGEIPIPAVKAEWSQRLEGMPNSAIRLALDHMHKVGQKFPPALTEFYALCDQFKPREAPRLAITDASRTEPPDHIEAKFGELLKRLQNL